MRDAAQQHRRWNAILERDEFLELSSSSIDHFYHILWNSGDCCSELGHSIMGMENQKTRLVMIPRPGEINSIY